ncbi:MAG: trypsin-like peptidase domain-containing protein [Planctomycetota bacterium]|nr:trypsin-like peptidase domain-containing protein [Planctomycetota bacterium]
MYSFVPRPNTATLSLWLLIALASDLRGQPDLSELSDIEKQVQQVVEANMESCVAISDRRGFGSGVIVNPDGLILTAGHVVTSRNRLEVIFPSGRRVQARSLGRNLSIDAGMVQLIGPGPWPAVKLADAPPKRGDWVVSLGHSGGFELGRKPPVRTGRILGDRKGQFVTDAVLIGGDSGGPLFNLEGELIGIHSSIGDSIAQNRHVPIDLFREHWERMYQGDIWGTLPSLVDDDDDDDDNAENQPAKKPRMGITLSRGQPGALVNQVDPRGPAHRAGIRKGDRITRFGGESITSADQLIQLIGTKKVGQTFDVEFQRNRILYKVQVRLEAVKN